jgi:hypothetical protein
MTAVEGEAIILSSWPALSAPHANVLDVERIAVMLSIAVERTIRCDIEANQAALLEKVAQNLLEIARETQDRAAARPPRSPDSVQTRDSLAD